MPVHRRSPEWTLERERRKHHAAVRYVIRSMNIGECEPDTGTEAIAVLMDWYEVTGMNIDRPLPAWLRDRKE